MRKYLNFIGGEWLPAKSGQHFQNHNPADTQETVTEYPASGQEEASAAIHAAQSAYPAWAAMTPVARGRVLSKASHVLEARKRRPWHVRRTSVPQLPPKQPSVP